MNRITSYNKRLFKAVSDKKLWMTVLGEIGGYQIWFLRNYPALKHSIPRLLIVSGFHGEEQAGPLGLLKWLEDFDPHLYLNVNLSMIPIVNPIGFNKNERYNDKKEKTNCGFCHPENGDLPSREGVILIKNFPMLKASAKDGFMSLHEDINAEKFYLYTFERSKEPGTFTQAMKDEQAKFFEPLTDEIVYADAMADKGIEVKDGVVYRLCDGSMEDFCFHEGINRVVTTETPGTFKMEKRIEANVALINKFIEISI
jgi:hypothetical protein